MTETPRTLSHPVAQFVIERVAGTGYCVTSSSGPECSVLQGDAISLLDKIKQPDAEQDGIACEWVGPVGDKDYFVGVTTTITRQGESRYSQTWFGNRQRHRSIAPHFFTAMIMSLVVGLGLGASGVWVAVTAADDPNITPASDPQEIAAQNHLSNGSERRGRDIAYDNLDVQVLATEELRKKLEEYFQQDGLAANPSLPVVEEQRTVRVTAFTDRAPPPVAHIDLSNVEVRALLKLLDQLDKLGANKRNSVKE